MQKCSQLRIVFFQTLGHSSVTQNLTIIKKKSVSDHHICNVKMKENKVSVIFY